MCSRYGVSISQRHNSVNDNFLEVHPSLKCFIKFRFGQKCKTKCSVQNYVFKPESGVYLMGERAKTLALLRDRRIPKITAHLSRLKKHRTRTRP